MAVDLVDQIKVTHQVVMEAKVAVVLEQIALTDRAHNQEQMVKLTLAAVEEAVVLHHTFQFQAVAVDQVLSL